jgi:hypothetical protein
VSDDKRSDRPPTFQDVAHLVGGCHPPPWLAGHLEWWASSLRAARMVDKDRPTKVLMKKKLNEIKSAALLLQRALTDTPTRKFLELAPSGRIKNVHPHDLRNLAERAERAAASPILSTRAGKTKSGSGRALLSDDLSAKSYCAAMIFEMWLYFRHSEPGPRNQSAAKAADAYWRASGGGSTGWGADSLKGWRPHFEKVRSTAQAPPVAGLRLVWRRDLIQAASRGKPPWFLGANN